ncbi:hypothetical protein FKM82_022271 [Ascaphus truei]
MPSSTPHGSSFGGIADFYTLAFWLLAPPRCSLAQHWHSPPHTGTSRCRWKSSCLNNIQSRTGAIRLTEPTLGTLSLLWLYGPHAVTSPEAQSSTVHIHEQLILRDGSVSRNTQYTGKTAQVACWKKLLRVS